jgi:hypothetical protein
VRSPRRCAAELSQIAREAERVDRAFALVQTFVVLAGREERAGSKGPAYGLAVSIAPGGARVGG